MSSSLDLESLLGEPVLDEPVAPEDWECCGSECGDYCVYEIYRREKHAYDAQQLKMKQLLSSS